MKFNKAATTLYLETDASGIGLGNGLSQVRDSMNCGYDEKSDNAILQLTVFVSNSLSSAEQHYSNVEHGALGVLHGLEKFHHYYFMKEGCDITDQKSLVATLSNDVTTLSQQFQSIMLRIQE